MSVLLGLLIGTLVVLFFQLIRMWFDMGWEEDDTDTYDRYEYRNDRMRRRQKEREYERVYESTLAMYNRSGDTSDGMNFERVGEGYGFYTDNTVDGFLPYIEYNHTDNKDAIAFAIAVERRPIVYRQRNGRVIKEDTIEAIANYYSDPQWDRIITDFETLAPDYMIDEAEDFAEAIGRESIADMSYDELEMFFEHNCGRSLNPIDTPIVGMTRQQHRDVMSGI